jgi:hypothetical protein
VKILYPSISSELHKSAINDPSNNFRLHMRAVLDASRYLQAKLIVPFFP